MKKTLSVNKGQKNKKNESLSHRLGFNHPFEHMLDRQFEYYPPRSQMSSNENLLRLFQSSQSLVANAAIYNKKTSQLYRTSVRFCKGPCEGKPEKALFLVSLLRLIARHPIGKMSLNIPSQIIVIPQGLLPMDNSVKRKMSLKPKSEDSRPQAARKRANLDHMTPEEKLMRRKLKNRVAAQNARDKKRAKMEEMEETIKQLQEETRLLQQQNFKLKEINARLMEGKSAELQVKEEFPSPPSPPDSLASSCSSPTELPPCLTDQTFVVSRPHEPAEFIRDLQQQGQGRVRAKDLACLFWTQRQRQRSQGDSWRTEDVPTT